MMRIFTRHFIPACLLILTGIAANAQPDPDCNANPTYGDPPPASFFNTGTDGNGGTLPGGSPDLNWQVSTTGINGPYNSAYVMDPVPAAYYTSPWPDCAWIAHNVTGSHVGNYDMYYKFDFTLDCFNSCHQSFLDPGVFCLNLDFFADNSVYEIIINGVVQNIPGIPVANPYFYQGYIQANMVTVSLCSNWQPGPNELIIHVQSGEPYEGFLSQASINPPPPIGDSVSATICQGDGYVFGPDTLNTTGTYTHVFTTQWGCDSTVTLDLTVNPSYNTTQHDTICNGDSVYFAGTYYRTTGFYTHNDTTSLGCDSITNLQLTVNGVTASATANNVLCNGDATGSITVNAANNPPGYTYANGAGPYGPSNQFTALIAGTYTIHTKAPTGCIRDTIITITEPTVLQINGIATVSPLCSYSSGSFTVSVSGGTPNYSYALDAGPFTGNNVLSSVVIGSHTIHVKDANGCTKDTSITMPGPNAISATINITNEPCHGQTLGVISVTGAGGTAPYTYALDAGNFGGGIFSNLAASTYTVHVKDANSCVYDTTVQVTQPPSLGSTVDINPLKCYGDNNGSISITPNGGTPPFVYSLNGATAVPNNLFNNLSASIDSIVVTDNNGCTIDTVILLTEPDPLKVTDLLVQGVKCYGGADGLVQVFAAGGTLPYTYAVDQLLYTPSGTINSLQAGQHTIHIKDNNDCVTDSIVDIIEPAPLGFDNIGITNTSCGDTKDGIVELNGLGGTPPYMYSGDATNFSDNNKFSGLASGEHTYYVRDSAGCITDTALNVGKNPDILIAGSTITGISCFGAGDGSLEIVASGGTPPLRYQLDGSPATPTANPQFTGLRGGTHIITVTDSNNCTQTILTMIPEPAPLSLTMSTNGNRCQGPDDNGAVHVKVSGGTPPYIYTWSTNPDQTSYQSSITGLANGLYSVRVTDAHDCNADGSAQVDYETCCTPDIPNAFTPNNDGKNDYFRPVFKGNMQLEELVIYNRYGQEIYSTTDIHAGWDGTYKGVPQDIGVYYFYMTFYCGHEDLNKQIIKGDITLIR